MFERILLFWTSTNKNQSDFPAIRSRRSDRYLNDNISCPDFARSIILKVILSVNHVRRVPASLHARISFIIIFILIDEVVGAGEPNAVYITEIKPIMMYCSKEK